MRYSLQTLRADVDHEPVAGYPAVLGPVCEWLPLLDRTTEPAAAAVLGMALSAKPAATRLAAVDAALTLFGQDHLDLELVVAALAAQVAGGLAKLNRLAVSIDEICLVQPELARDLSVRVAARQVDHPALAKLLTAAVEASVAAGPAPLPAPLVTLAERKGSSRAVVGARRLLELSPDRTARNTD